MNRFPATVRSILRRVRAEWRQNVPIGTSVPSICPPAFPRAFPSGELQLALHLTQPGTVTSVELSVRPSPVIACGSRISQDVFCAQIRSRQGPPGGVH